MKKKLAAIVLAACASMAYAEKEKASGTPVQILIYGNGQILVTGFTFPNASVCSNNGGVFIETNHPSKDMILSAFLAAKAAQMPMEVTAETGSPCWYPKITSDASSYFRIK